jgi:phosphate transport system permease protein
MCSAPVSPHIRPEHGGGAGAPAPAPAVQPVLEPVAKTSEVSKTSEVCGSPGVRPVLAHLRRGKRFWRQGEPFVWATGAALSAVLLATLLLVAVVMVNGLGVFWPAAIVELRLDDGAVVAGRWMRTDVNPDTGVETVQLKTGNREIDPQRIDFHWYPVDKIAESDHPDEIYVLERWENGDFYGFLTELRSGARFQRAADTRDSGHVENVPHGNVPHEDFRQAIVEVRRRHAGEVKPIADQLSALNYRLQGTRSAIFKLEYQARHADASSKTSEVSETSEVYARLAGLRAAEVEIRRASDRLVAQKIALEAELRTSVARFRTASGQVHDVALVDVVRAYQPNAMSWPSKLGQYVAKLWELLWEEPRESNTEGGLFPAIFGTVMLVFLMSITCFPLGVLAGVYLGEYARQGLLVRLVRIAVNNLAGIPSIVYGIFGLGFFVYGVGGAIDRWFFPERVEAGVPTYGTGGILWASLTLGLLTVPVVIVATEEALRTIPRSFREGSYALGATKVQTLVRVLIPMASPGIMTGFILAMARAAGEVAPLMITGVVKLAPNLPMDGQFPFFHPDRKFMHLGFHIYDIGFQSPNVEATKPMVYVTTFLLVLIVLAMSSTAIYLRNRMRKRYQFRSI